MNHDHYTRAIYTTARATYRRLRHADAQWTPGNYIPTALNSKAPTRPTTAANYLKLLPPAVAAALTAKPGDRFGGRLPRGPKAQRFVNSPLPGFGTGHNLPLFKRVALRRTLKAMTQFTPQRAVEAAQTNLRG